MPIYEYHCENCGKDFEYLVLGKDDAACPKCDSSQVNRVLSRCAFVSKGSGGEVTRSSASSCSGCSASTCAGCH